MGLKNTIDSAADIFLGVGRHIDIGHHVEIKDPAVKKLTKEAFSHPREIKYGMSKFKIGIPFPRSLDAPFMPKEIPHRPHVFIAHDLWLNDRTHNDILLTDVPIIFAHGNRVNNEWRFADGQPVIQVVRDYEAFAVRNGYPSLEMIVSCNPDQKIQQWASEGIKFLDLKFTDISHPVIQSVGDEIQAYFRENSTNSRRSTGSNEAGRINFRLRVPGEFANLEEVIAYKKTLSQVTINPRT